MFCPRCGIADQTPDTYCRDCGVFLPDFDKIKKKETPIEEHIKINSFFSLATAIVSLILASALFIVLISKGSAPFIIYPVFGFLIAITAWQVQTFIRTRMLKKQVEKLRPPRPDDDREVPLAKEYELNEAKFDNVVPTSVTERKTRKLRSR